MARTSLNLFLDAYKKGFSIALRNGLLIDTSARVKQQSIPIAACMQHTPTPQEIDYYNGKTWMLSKT